MQPWPWWFAGLVIGLIIPALHLLAGKGFGISGSMQQIGAMCCTSRGPELLRKQDWRRGIWVVVFVAGIVCGGFIATNFLTAEPFEFLPPSYQTASGAMRLIVGGFLIGFGARYAGGCTSGNAISGISNLSWPSLVATVFFFVGGLSVTWLLKDVIF